MLSKISKACVNVVQRFLPDPFIFCILLTMFVFVVAMPLTGQGPLQCVKHWGNGVADCCCSPCRWRWCWCLGLQWRARRSLKRSL